jgi:two-component system cell cycle sensor histidine kinase PleC
MSALGPLTEEAPPLQPETTNTETTRIGRKPILSAGTGL